MEFNRLGNSELIVSKYCLGTMTFGEATNENDSHLQMEKALDSEVNFFDTAELYPTCPMRSETTGDTERIIGNWFKKNKHYRNKIILATKVVGKGYKAIRNGQPITPKGMEIALNDSLKKLNTDYIDLYQLHWPNRGSYHFRQNWEYDPSNQEKNKVVDDICCIVKQLNEFKKQGKIRAIGISNETSWGLIQFVNATKQYKNLCIASIQNEYSLLCRLYDTDMSEVSHHENVPLLSYSPLAGGILTGKYLNNAIPVNSRMSRIPKVFGRVNSRSLKAVQAYLNLSRKYEIDPVHFALNFCKKKPFMGSIIFGATTNKQLDKIIKGINIDLSDEIMSEIDEINKKFPMTF